MNGLQPKIFYQSSMPRSGSTLLQNLLGQNPDFYVTATSGVLELIFGARANYTNSPEFKAQKASETKRAFLNFCRQGMEGYFRGLSDKPYVIDKSRGWGVHFDMLEMIFSEKPKIICMVRDLRQILSSMEKKFRQSPERLRSIENHANLTGTTTFKRAIQGLQSPPVGLALDRLLEIHHRGWSKNMLFIRFEDLTTDPDGCLKKIYQYLDVKEFKHNFDKIEQITQEDDSVFGIVGLHDIKPKLEIIPNDYVQVLGLETVKYIQTTCAWYFKLFNYHVKSV